MSEQPIRVQVEVGGQSRSLVIVGDPADGILAFQVGRSVSVAILEMSET